MILTAKYGTIIFQLKNNNMECVICKNGKTKKGKVTVTLDRNGSIIVVKDVPAQVCQNCGEYYLDNKTTAEILKRAEQAVEKGAEIEVIKMGKVA
jgi:YgiT-type zinc finger domain-containing protein